MVSQINSEYKINNAGERYFWVSYFAFILLSSLIGDSLILIGSIRHGALKLNRVLVVIIQHIAVSDLINSTVFVFPTTVSLIADRWVFGDALSLMQFQFFSQIFILQVSHCLVSVLCCSKLLLLKFPMRARNWTRKETHAICASIWMLSVCAPMIPLTLLNPETDLIAFDYSYYNVMASMKFKSTIAVFMITVFIVSVRIIPTLIVAITMVPILRYLIDSRLVARRARGQLRWQGILTVLLTATVFCIATLPKGLLALLSILASNSVVAPQFEISTSVSLTRIARFLTALNIMCNFYIYCFTVLSFRQFVKTLAIATWQSLSSIICRLFSSHCNRRRNEMEAGGAIVIAMRNFDMVTEPRAESAPECGIWMGPGDSDDRTGTAS
jgi:hypothetical protein